MCRLQQFLTPLCLESWGPTHCWPQGFKRWGTGPPSRFLVVAPMIGRTADTHWRASIRLLSLLRVAVFWTLFTAGGHVRGQHDTWARFAAIVYDSNSRQFVYNASQWNHQATSYICQLPQLGRFQYQFVQQLCICNFSINWTLLCPWGFTQCCDPSVRLSSLFLLQNGAFHGRYDNCLSFRRRSPIWVVTGSTLSNWTSLMRRTTLPNPYH